MDRKINWQKGSAFNHGYVEGTDYRVERMRAEDKHGFLLSNSRLTYLYVSGCVYPSPADRDAAILEELNKRGV